MDSPLPYSVDSLFILLLVTKNSLSTTYNQSHFLREGGGQACQQASRDWWQWILLFCHPPWRQCQWICFFNMFYIYIFVVARDSRLFFASVICGQPSSACASTPIPASRYIFILDYNNRHLKSQQYQYKCNIHVNVYTNVQRIANQFLHYYYFLFSVFLLV